MVFHVADVDFYDTSKGYFWKKENKKREIDTNSTPNKVNMFFFLKNNETPIYTQE